MVEHLQNSSLGPGGMTQQRQRIHPHKFTLWVAMASIIMMFAGLTSAYIVKSNGANWEVVQTPSAFIYSTIVIVVSSIIMQMALRSFIHRSMQQYRLLLGITWLLGIAFVAIQWFGFQWMWNHGVHFAGASSAGQFLYIIAGLHALHVLGGVIALTVMLLQAFFSHTRNYNRVPVEIVTTYWHFVDLLWLYLFIFFVVIK